MPNRADGGERLELPREARPGRARRGSPLRTARRRSRTDRAHGGGNPRVTSSSRRANSERLACDRGKKAEPGDERSRQPPAREPTEARRRPPSPCAGTRARCGRRTTGPSSPRGRRGPVPAGCEGRGPGSRSPRGAAPRDASRTPNCSRARRRASTISATASADVAPARVLDEVGVLRRDLRAADPMAAQRRTPRACARPSARARGS